jgi:ankyrin repeat protein
VIHGKARHLLLNARNKNGDTPLHRAARARHRRMVAHLMCLARSDNGGGVNEKVKAILRVQNKRGETVLHDAVRSRDGDMITLLMAEDPQLARVPLSEGASPLYLAVELGHDDIAQQLYEKDSALSYSGPDGRNALHAAVLKGQGTLIYFSEILFLCQLLPLVGFNRRRGRPGILRWLGVSINCDPR